MLAGMLGLALSVVFLSGFGDATVPAVRVEIVVAAILSAVALWAGYAAQQLLQRLNRVLDAFPDVLTALWGNRDAEGKRHGGLVGDVHAMRQELGELREGLERVPQAIAEAQEAKLVATTAAEAVRTLQRSHRQARTG